MVPAPTTTRSLPLPRNGRVSRFSMRRALGGGPEALAVLLALLWAVGLHATPLVHAVQHVTSEQGHCHGAVCHDLPAADPDRAEVRDGSLPSLGDRGLAHGDVLALVLAPMPLAAAVLGIRPPDPAVSPQVLEGGQPPAAVRARGPPGALPIRGWPTRAAA